MEEVADLRKDGYGIWKLTLYPVRASSRCQHPAIALDFQVCPVPPGALVFFARAELAPRGWLQIEKRRCTYKVPTVTKECHPIRRRRSRGRGRVFVLQMAYRLRWHPPVTLKLKRPCDTLCATCRSQNGDARQAPAVTEFCVQRTAGAEVQKPSVNYVAIDSGQGDPGPPLGRTLLPRGRRSHPGTRHRGDPQKICI